MSSILLRFCSAISVVILLAASASGQKNSRNILFIYVEDLGYYTSERAAREPNARITGLKTPNLDKLAAQSVNFTRAFCGQSVCSPSKGAILSGLLPHANGIWRNVHNNHPQRGGPEKWIPLPSPLTKENDPIWSERATTTSSQLRPASLRRAIGRTQMTRRPKI